MVFSTYTFIFIFLPVTFAGYRLLNVLKLYTAAKLWLVLASLYFYAQGSSEFVFLFIAAVFFNYLIGYLILRTEGPHSLRNKRIFLTIGLIQNIGFLGYYKYTDFIIENLNRLSGESYSLWNILLPLGISFFTFQLIAFLVDCYKGNTKQHSIIDFLLFITFFPQLIVGPIVHHKDMVPQYQNKEQRLFNKQNFMLGVFIFSIGCAKKILLADPLTGYGEGFFSNTAGAEVLMAWLAVISYTFAYYFDLSGYVDMAIGLGLFFNIILPQNFNSPYKSRNFREYWQRWHITLSKFLSDYIFRSLFKKGDGALKFYYAVMVTFLVSGFWHGAGWSFVIWGLLNGIFVCAAHFMTRHHWQLPIALAWMLTFAGIVGTRILFVSSGTTQAVEVTKMLFNFSLYKGLSFSEILNHQMTFIAFNLYIIVILMIAMGIAFFAKNTSQIAENFKPNIKYAAWAALLFVLALSQMTSVSDFLYFQF